MLYRVGDELVDQERQDGGLLRWNPHVVGRDIERDREPGRGQRPVRLIGSMAGNDIDSCTAELLFIAEEIVDGRDGLNAADGLSQMRRPRSTFIVTKLDREKRRDSLYVVAHTMMHLLEQS